MFRMLLLLAAATVVVTTAPPARAADQWVTAGDSVLANMRGGFALAPGLMVSFGIVRTVRIDGAVASHTSVFVADLRTMTPQQAEQLSQQLSSTMLVQNGAGNLAQLSPGQLAPGIVIQNTENNRTLQALTELNVVTNGMGLLQGINLNQTLNDALKGALGR
jgi:hypothetical protein